MPLGPRGGLAGYLVTPVGGAGYSLYVTGDGHGVAGLLYGPDGVLITGGQLAAVRGENRLAGTATKPLPMLAPSGAASVAPVGREAGPPGCGVTGIAPPEGASTMNAHGAGARDAVVPLEVATRDTANRVSRAVLFERAASAFGFTLGERGPLVVLFGDPSLSMVALGRRADRPGGDGRQAAAACRAGGAVWVLLRRTGRRESPQVSIRRKPGSHATDGPSGVQDARERIAGNNALFDAWGERSVPLIAYRTMQGGIAHRVGDIADLGAWLRELGDE